MENKLNGRGFDKMIGKTIQSVNTTAINSIKFTFTDNTSIDVDCEEQHFGVGVIQVYEPENKNV